MLLGVGLSIQRMSDRSTPAASEDGRVAPSATVQGPVATTVLVASERLDLCGWGPAR